MRIHQLHQVLLLISCVYSIDLEDSGGVALRKKQHLEPKFSEIKSIIDRILDIALLRMREKTPDPVKMQDEVKQYKKKLFLVEINAEMVMYHGKLWGLNQIARYGDVTFVRRNGTIYITSMFSFEELTFTYDFEARVFGFSPRGSINGSMENLIVQATIQVHPSWRQHKMMLDKVKLVKARKMAIYIDSKKVFDTVANYLLKIATSIFRTTLLNKLDKEIRHYIGEGIDINV